MISFCKIFYVSFIELFLVLNFLYMYFMGSDPNVHPFLLVIVVGGVSLIWTIDNLQCLDKETLDIIYFLIAHLQECFPEVIFSLGTNTEIVPLDSQGFVNEFLAK